MPQYTLTAAHTLCTEFNKGRLLPNVQYWGIIHTLILAQILKLIDKKGTFGLIHTLPAYAYRATPKTGAIIKTDQSS